jgi:hypothetical protein
MPGTHLMWLSLAERRKWLFSEGGDEKEDVSTRVGVGTRLLFGLHNRLSLCINGMAEMTTCTGS